MKKPRNARLETAATLASTDEQSSKDIVICLMVAVAETVLVLFAITGGVSISVALLVHCAVMLGLALVLDQRERMRLDARILAIAVVTTAVSGPLGAGMSALLGLYLRYRHLESELLSAWYDRISGHMQEDPALELHERIQAGRTLNPHIDARARFATILRSGPLDEKQRVLSVIAQKYHPGFAGLLQLALRSEDPPIRVQAAAVAARLRQKARIEVKALLGSTEVLHARDSASDLRHVGKLVACLRSGLLDEQDATGARELAKSLCRGVLVRDAGQDEASLVLADLLAGEDAHAEAIEMLRPLVGRGIALAIEPCRTSLVHLRRFAEAAALGVTPRPSTVPVPEAALAGRDLVRQDA